MVKCFRCGLEVENPVKTWVVTLGKVKRTRITFGTFQCSNCQTKFRASIKKEQLPSKPRSTYTSPPCYMTMVV